MRREPNLGRLRVVTVEPGFDQLLELAVEEIRQPARGNVAVLEGLLRMLGGVAAGARDPARTRARIRQVELIGASAEIMVGTAHDLARLQRLAASTIEHAAEQDGPPIRS